MSQDPTKDQTKETTDDHDSSPLGELSSDQNSPPANDNAPQIPTASQPSTSKSPPADDQPTATPSTVTRQPSDPLCAICLEPITDRTVAEPCLHEFCRRCIDSSLQTTNRCPTCRQRIERILFNFRSALDYDQREVEGENQNDRRVHRLLPENDPRYRQHFVQLIRLHQRRFEARNARELIRNLIANREHPENHPQLRQHLIENPREFVTVNVGQENEYLLPVWTINVRNTYLVILTDWRGVYLIDVVLNESNEYTVKYLAPNQAHLFNGPVIDDDFNPFIVSTRNRLQQELDAFSHLVSPDRLGSAINEWVNQRDSFERQRQQRQQRLQQQQVREVDGVEQNNRESDEPSNGQGAQATSRQTEDENSQKN